MPLRALCVVAACTVVAPGIALYAQPARPQFRAGVELLQLDVVVLDARRQPVTGLTAADFTVLDNGVETPIRAFTPIDLAASSPTDADSVFAAGRDVVTNASGSDEGRLVVILMDRTIPIEQPTLTARKIALAAVDALGPHDLAAVVSTSNSAVQTRAVQNLTADHARLRAAIEAGDPSVGMSGTAEGIMNMPGSPFRIDPMNDSRCLCGICVPETITRVADAVQGTPRRRKLLLFIGSSMIWQSTRPIAEAFQDPGCETRLKDARTAMFAALDRANLTVHSIDPQGLVNAGPQSQAAAMTRSSRSAIDSRQSGITTTLNERENLSVLPERTGGRVVVGANNPERTIPEIFRESASYYVLGIERAAASGGSGTRTIQVKVGRKGLRVVAQRQYAPTPPKVTATAASTAAAPIDDALRGLLPEAGLPLAMAVTAFSRPDGGAAVVRVNVNVASFAPPDGAAAALDVVVMAVDRTGKPLGTARQTSTIAARPPGSRAPAEVSAQSHLELPAGDYGLRVAVSDPASGQVASVFADITVPAFHDAALTLSGMSVEMVDRARSVASPTTRRRFARSDAVRAVLQIYQGTRRSEAPVAVALRVRILDAAGTVVRDQSLPFPPSSFVDRRTDCVVTLPLSAVVPGDYLLQLEAAADRHTSGSTLRFTVE